MCNSTIAQPLLTPASRLFRSVVLPLLAGIGLLCSSYSCAPTAAVVHPVEPVEKNLFQSEKHIVYKLSDGETPEGLAERFLGDRDRSWVIKEANHERAFRRGEFVVIPLKDRNKGGLSAEGYQTIPILTYHRFGERCSSVLCVPTSVFEQQIKYLKENGYHTVTPEELCAFLEYRQSLPKKSVIITMDDGYRSVYNIAYPILKKYGFTAIFFIYTDFVGVSSSAVTWDQLKEMKENGFTIGSHTIFHSDLTKKKEEETEAQFDARVKKELFGAKKIIDRKLEQDTYLLAYPYGRYDQRAIEYSRQAGYKIAMSVKRGGNPFFAHPFALKRDQILRRDMKIFLSRLETFHHLPLE